MQIRKAVESDYVSLMELYNEFVGSDRYSHHDNDSFRTVLHSPHNFIYVVEVDEKLIGFASFSVRHVVRYPKPIAELDELFIDPSYRKQGIGRKLMNQVEEKARDLGCHRAYIESNYKYKEGHAFYESLGYTNYGYHFLKNL